WVSNTNYTRDTIINYDESIAWGPFFGNRQPIAAGDYNTKGIPRSAPIDPEKKILSGPSGLALGTGARFSDKG
ncbi:MAG: hypothetical protein EBV82_10470, partial [Chitinophagia bacterium]|nr:hypothetical protein [Chitinophagia bacterium]